MCMCVCWGGGGNRFCHIVPPPFKPFGMVTFLTSEHAVSHYDSAIPEQVLKVQSRKLPDPSSIILRHQSCQAQHAQGDYRD